MLTSQEAVDVLDALGLRGEECDSVYRNEEGLYCIADNFGVYVDLTPAEKWQDVLVHVYGQCKQPAALFTKTMTPEKVAKFKTAINNIFKLNDVD